MQNTKKDLRQIVKDTLQKMAQNGVDVMKVDPNFVVQYTKQFLEMLGVDASESEGASENGTDTQQQQQPQQQSSNSNNTQGSGDSQSQQQPGNSNDQNQAQEGQESSNNQQSGQNLDNLVSDVLDEMKQEKQEEDAKAKAEAEERQKQKEKEAKQVKKQIEEEFKQLGNVKPQKLGQKPERYIENNIDKVFNNIDKHNVNSYFSREDRTLDMSRFNYFVQKMRSVMKDNLYDRTVRGKRSGKLDNLTAYKLMANNTKIFKKKQERKNKKYNICVVVDTSSSMISDKSIVYAAKVATLLTLALQRNNIDFSIVTFNERVREIKPYKEKMRRDQAEKLIDVFYDEATGYYNGATAGYDAVREANKIQRNHTEGHNITVFIGDGGFNHSRQPIPKGLSEKGATALEIKNLEKVSDIIPISVGSSVLSQYFTGVITVDDESQFVRAFLGRLDSIIKRG